MREHKFMVQHDGREWTAVEHDHTGRVANIGLYGSDILSAVRDEERDAFDNRPESLQSSDAEELCEELDSACDALDELISTLEDIE